ncbi:APC family permease [Thermoflavimicrobium dichotomicum]|uniref:Amino acid transporter n=1 Tax=Thermoflavimicrobium dichotomicum TaxID=46223 RepID=A0A1I3P6Q3_9BACL|nr:APC family permease [Thermoflavimicrobium dichotomicum]SFJ17213.1 Amino acid transporter [Thermoflavimicrobium dichotomicum]
MRFGQIKRLLIGSPLRTRQLTHEKLPKWKALAIFSSDALSSVAYATEEILLVLAIIGASAFSYSIPIAVSILILLLVVTLSYRQIVYTFPSGGGAYIVARENLNVPLSLIAGAALMIDYILTVAVSISSGVAALVSAFPSLIPWKVALAVFLIVILMMLNLRGIRESATIFAYPTYLFIFSVLIMIGFGSIQLWKEGWHGYQAQIGNQAHDLGSWVGILLLLRAFASGCSALTGVEAISNGVPAFRSPAPRNAAITMIWMSLLLGIMFFGITLLAQAFGVAPKEHETVVSQIAEHIFGRGPLYYLIQIATMLILFLAANTSFAGFPQLTSIIAQDRFLPRNLAMRGDRLVYSNGIILLSLLSILLIIGFKGDTHSLIPLYAVGVFLSFTIAQLGMVKVFLNEKKKNMFRIAITGIGTMITGIVTVITVISKFTEGAWMVTVAIPLLVWLFFAIRKHYNDIAKELRLVHYTQPKKVKTKVIIPISGITKVVSQSISYAKGISDDIVVVTVDFDDDHAGQMREKWEEWNPGVPLIILRSPYRTLISPLLKYIDSLEKEKEEGEFITVLVPQFIIKKWWHTFLHNQTALLLKALLIFRKDVVVSTIPFHLHH